MMLPLAHVGHWAWVFYAIPVVIVVGGIVRSTLEERRRRSRDPATEHPEKKGRSR